MASIDAGPPATDDAAAKARARKAALEEAAEFGMFGLLGVDAPDAGGVGVDTSRVGPTRLSAGSVPAPRVRMGAMTVNGRLPKEVVERIVRQRFGSFRRCYQNGLKLNPSLSGRVTVRFVIGSDGHVSTTQDAGSDLPDQNAAMCVVHAFADIDFPQPEGGIVVATAPLEFRTSSQP